MPGHENVKYPTPRRFGVDVLRPQPTGRKYQDRQHQTLNREHGKPPYGFRSPCHPVRWYLRHSVYIDRLNGVLSKGLCLARLAPLQYRSKIRKLESGPPYQKHDEALNSPSVPSTWQVHSLTDDDSPDMYTSELVNNN